MTLQELFDLYVRSAMDGTFPGWDDKRNSCCYRGDNGTKCAVGVVIPHDAYNPVHEELSLSDLLDQHQANWFRFFPKELDTEDLERLQSLHDDNVGIREDQPTFNRQSFLTGLCDVEQAPFFAGVDKTKAYEALATLAARKE